MAAVKSNDRRSATLGRTGATASRIQPPLPEHLTAVVLAEEHHFIGSQAFDQRFRNRANPGASCSHDAGRLRTKFGAVRIPSGCSSACLGVRPRSCQLSSSGSIAATFTRAEDTTRAASPRAISWSPQKAETLGT